ncbi:hypothetical protein BDR26DRAFT_565760 [Obelidium mucronatum]|nr:hypothetical protein BDR26DRAFT_565760 [Obelidium mucronatum]
MTQKQTLRLPRDVADHIMRFVAGDNKPDLLECALVSRWFGASALAQLWRTVTLPVNEWDALRPLFARAPRLHCDYRQFVHALLLLAPPASSAAAPSSSASSASSSASASAPPPAALGLARFVAGVGARLRVLVVDASVFCDDDLWVISSKCTGLESISLASFSAANAVGAQKFRLFSTSDQSV